MELLTHSSIHHIDFSSSDGLPIKSRKTKSLKFPLRKLTELKYSKRHRARHCSRSPPIHQRAHLTQLPSFEYSADHFRTLQSARGKPRGRVTWPDLSGTKDDKCVFVRRQSAPHVWLLPRLWVTSHRRTEVKTRVSEKSISAQLSHHPSGKLTNWPLSVHQCRL